MAKEQYKCFADKKRAPGLELKPGDFVYISTKKLRHTQPSKKLEWKYLGPFKVLEVAFKLSLPKNLKHLHPAFHQFAEESASTRWVAPSKSATPSHHE